MEDSIWKNILSVLPHRQYKIYEPGSSRKKSFDIIERTLIIGGQNSAFYFIDGFTKDETMLKLMDSFLNISADDMPEDATSFSTSCIPYVEVDILGDFDSIFKNLLSGVTCLFY